MVEEDIIPLPMLAGEIHGVDSATMHTMQDIGTVIIMRCLIQVTVQDLVEVTTFTTIVMMLIAMYMAEEQILDLLLVASLEDR